MNGESAQSESSCNYSGQARLIAGRLRIMWVQLQGFWIRADAWLQLLGGSGRCLRVEPVMIAGCYSYCLDRGNANPAFPSRWKRFYGLAFSRDRGWWNSGGAGPISWQLRCVRSASAPSLSWPRRPPFFNPQAWFRNRATSTLAQRWLKRPGLRQRQ